jgi:hypothetical protein
VAAFPSLYAPGGFARKQLNPKAPSSVRREATHCRPSHEHLFVKTARSRGRTTTLEGRGVREDGGAQDPRRNFTKRDGDKP